MHQPSSSREEKQAVWVLVQQVIGPLYTPSRRRQDWRLAQDNSTSVFVTFSKLNDGNKQYWFDVGRYDLATWSEYRNAFVVFVAGSRHNVFVIPVAHLQEHIRQSNINESQDGSFKLHIMKHEIYRILELPSLDIMTYHQNYPLLKGEHLTGPAYRQYEAEEPEDIVPGQTYFEGATKNITVNVYERSTKARSICLQRYGFDCTVCGFNFETIYGRAGSDFIQVHHLKPLSEITGTYQLDPLDDLRPVCPNCHAMLHRRKPAYSIDEIKEMIQQRQAER